MRDFVQTARSATRAAVLVIALACCQVPTALAQWNPQFTAGLGRGYGQIALSQSVISNTRRIGTDAGQGAGTLTYITDPAVSEQTRREVINTLSERSPELRGQMELAFADDKVLRDFEHFTAAHGGYSSHNVADDMAALLLVSWEIITGTTATDPQVRGAHRQVQGVFLTTPPLRAMTNSERQQMAERIAYQVVISSSARDEYRRLHDPQHLAELRESAAMVMRRQGIDLSQLHLTEQGFSKNL